ncbi:MAG TPA: M56 family metallopeptidase, partial [Thermoanaerobaculia bacterium]|nr:M56 family metallopeptidase [Thermoanaerobaculia bacterium]
RFTDAIQQPMTFGSRILLPHEAETWDDARLEAVLLHERAHVERRDSLLGLLSDITCAVYWFHPLAWIAARRSMLERERACDEAVLASHIAPTAYATTLLDVARGRALGIAMADRSHLETRIRAILDPTIRRRMTRVSRVMVVGGALVAAPLLAALTPRGIEPDLLGDSIASPFSERIGVDDIPNVSATGPDAALIAQLQDFARRPPQSEIDFVGDRARWALHQVRNGELVTPLLDMLDHHDWRVRAYAAFILGYGRDTRATAPLTAALRDPIWRVRASASSALEHLADPAAAPAMRAALDDDAWQVRVCAVHYFTNIGASRELFESMKTDRHIAVRMAAEEALQ